MNRHRFELEMAVAIMDMLAVTGAIASAEDTLDKLEMSMAEVYGAVIRAARVAVDAEVSVFEEHGVPVVALYEVSEAVADVMTTAFSEAYGAGQYLPPDDEDIRNAATEAARKVVL